jgi:hypothetical protein
MYLLMAIALRFFYLGWLTFLCYAIAFACVSKYI